MSSRKKLVGVSLALTLAFSSLMLVKAMFFSPRKSVVVKTGNSGLRTWEEKPDDIRTAVPGEAEPVQKAGPAEAAAVPEKAKEPAAAQRVNINTAYPEELETLPGIGEYLAEQIVTFRGENGSFKKIEEIKKVPGIGPAKYKAVEEFITVGDR